MKEYVFATNNKYKLEEIQNIIKNKFTILSLKDINCNEELPETGETLEENATQKAFYIYNNYKLNCFADDTGLEIEALNNRPGVYSARYAGEKKNFDDNIVKVLEELKGIKSRYACFRTVIALVINGEVKLFEGRIDGKITEERRGTNGFGYDSIFIPREHFGTFAEMSLQTKNSLSHRYLAIDKLIKSGLL